MLWQVINENHCPSYCEQRFELPGAMDQVRPLVTDTPITKHLVLTSALKTLEHRAGFPLDKNMLQGMFNGCKTKNSGAH